MWNNHLIRIFLSKHHLYICVVSKFPCRVKSTIHFEYDETNFLHTLQEVKIWLQKHVRYATIEWIISNRHCLFLVVPWSDYHFDTDFSQKLVIKQFEQNFSEKSINYEYYISKFDYEENFIATFIKKELLNIIRQFSADTRYSTVSIQPLLSCVWNQYYNKIIKNNLDFIIVESDNILKVKRNQNSFIELSMTPFQKRLLSNQYIAFAPYLEQKIEYSNLHFLKSKESAVAKIYDYALCGIMK